MQEDMTAFGFAPWQISKKTRYLSFDLLEFWSQRPSEMSLKISRQIDFENQSYLTSYSRGEIRKSLLDEFDKTFFKIRVNNFG